ncbi:MAG: membrane protein insertase YidC [Candidatus Omnitrophica bacterium]|nr:membrane protein insertase YidC [Candidatus Omnitrophota bacterium]MDD5670690.1 membrane protein insertase YidC [Candidatus Omnitrophota bacterium]
MSLNNQEPGMDKNFLIAMLLSMLVIMGYPMFMKWIAPPPADETVQTEETILRPNTPEREVLPLEVSEKPAIGTLAPPTVVEFENDLYSIRFSTLGAAVIRLHYKGVESHGKKNDTVFYDGENTQPGIFGVRFGNDEDDLTQKIFDVKKEENSSQVVEFVIEKPDEYRLTKRYIMESDQPAIHLTLVVENLSPREKHFPVELINGMQVDLADPLHTSDNEAVAWTDKVESAKLDRIAKKGYAITGETMWTGLIKKYFAILTDPGWKSIAFEAKSEADVIWTNTKMEPITIPSGGSVERNILIFAGPQQYETLKSFKLGLENILSKGFFGLFKVWLLLVLKFLNHYTHNYGVAIILLTLLIKGLFAPLTHISYKSMKKMQVIQPKLKALQERYKKDPEKLNRETMELFKRNRVNPMAGCLPMLVQMPILLAMFRLLPEAIELKGAPFMWWIQDLSQPDRFAMLPFTIPFLGWQALNLLPVLMILTQFWYQKVTPQVGTSPEQAKMMNFMPVFFGFICYNMSSGLVLYWIVQNLLSIIQQVFVNRIVVVLHHEDRE